MLSFFQFDCFFYFYFLLSPQDPAQRDIQEVLINAGWVNGGREEMGGGREGGTHGGPYRWWIKPGFNSKACTLLSTKPHPKTDLG